MDGQRLILLLLLLVSACGRPQVANVEPSPTVSRQMREYKTEVIRSRILNDLPEPPLAVAPQNIPQSVINLLVQKKVEESLLAEGKNLIAYPLNENSSCWNNTFCAKFEFELPPEDKPVSSMHVWLPKQEVHTTVSACFSSTLDNDGCVYFEAHSEASTELGWSVFELPSRNVLERGSDQQFGIIEVISESSIVSTEQKPFLVSNLHSERKRRSTHTNRNCTCCLVDFYVSFKEIGLHWVVAPVGFSANMCYGKCSSQLNSYPSHYHSIMSTLFKNKTVSEEQKEDLWTPCCSPTKLSPLSMIYVAGNNTNANNNNNSSSSFIYHKIPDMITESCGCW